MLQLKQVLFWNVLSLSEHFCKQLCFPRLNLNYFPSLFIFGVLSYQPVCPIIIYYYTFLHYKYCICHLQCNNIYLNISINFVIKWYGHKYLFCDLWEFKPLKMPLTLWKWMRWWISCISSAYVSFSLLPNEWKSPVGKFSSCSLHDWSSPHEQLPSSPELFHS